MDTTRTHDLRDVTHARAVPPTLLDVTFDDGASGRIDLALRLNWQGVFAELRADPVLFAQASVDQERAVVVWPNGADLDSDLLHAWLLGRERPEWAE